MLHLKQPNQQQQQQQEEDVKITNHVQKASATADALVACMVWAKEVPSYNVLSPQEVSTQYPTQLQPCFAWAWGRGANSPVSGSA